MDFTSMYDPPYDLCDEEKILELQFVLYQWGLPRDVIEKMGILKLPWHYAFWWHTETSPETGTVSECRSFFYLSEVKKSNES